MGEANDIQTKNSEAKSSTVGTKLIFLLSACCFILGCSQQYIMGVPDQVATSLNITLGNVSLMMTAFALCNAFIAPVVVMFTSHYPARIQLLIGLGCMGAGLLMTVFVHSFALQMIARGIMGMGNGTFVATAYSSAQKLAAPGKQASAMANVALGFSAANVMGMPIARALRETVNWQMSYFVIFLFAAIAFLVITKVFPEMDSDSEVVTIKDRLAPLANKSVICAYAGTALVTCAFACFYTYITPFLDVHVPQFSAYLSIVLLIIGAMSMVGTKFCGWLADRTGLRNALLTSFIGGAVMLTIIFFSEGAGIGLVIVICIWQLFAFGFLPVQNTLLASVAGDGARMAIALSSSFLQLGNAIGSAISGVVISTAPYGILPIVALPFSLLGIGAEILVFVFTAKKKRQAK